MAGQFEQSDQLADWVGILNAALDCVVLMDDRGRIVEFNDSAVATFGYRREDAVGAELAELVIPEPLRARHRQGLARYVTTGASEILGRRIEMTAVRSDGAEFPVELTVTRAEPLGLFVGFVRDLSERKRSERRLAAQHRVTRVLAEASSLEQAAPRILEAICETLGWQVGCIWELDQRAASLQCVHVWRSALADADEFERVSSELTFAPGVGLPGRVWNAGAPIWVENIAADPAFPRAEVAFRAGLHGAFAAPIAIGSHVLGTIEFFSGEVREPDDDLLQMIGAIGSQLG